jgi:hypothetical protein
MSYSAPVELGDVPYSSTVQHIIQLHRSKNYYEIKHQFIIDMTLEKLRKTEKEDK